MDDPGTGKSGSSFCSTWDGAFKLKFGLKSSTSMNEPKNLLMLMKGTDKTFGLLEHFKRNRMSLLNRYSVRSQVWTVTDTDTQKP